MILMLAYLFFIVGVTLLVLKSIFKRFNYNYPIKMEKKNPSFAILIPARYESNVIEDLLISLEKQTLKIATSNIYVIIESKSDRTYDIAKKHGVNVFIRKKLDLKRKGYALMEVVEAITKDKEYDAYFIFDADNVLDRNYLKEMQKTYLQGYDMGIGYRNIKNKTNALAVASSHIFTIVNDLSNRTRSRYSLNCNASGTGFYLSGKVINQLKTYPFHSLTEDYELSMYACLHNLTTFYNSQAMFYDEQPTNIKTYNSQRTRWIKGYFEVRRKYFKDLIRAYHVHNPNIGSIFHSIVGIYDIVMFIISFFLILLSILVKSNHPIILSLLFIILVYLLLCLFTAYVICQEKRFELSFSLKVKSLLLHPVLLFLYLPCLIKAIVHRHLAWEVIEHGKKE